jgi:SAM-dependent methyltransferase
MLNKMLLKKIQSIGPAGLLLVIYRRIVARPIASFDLCRRFVAGTIGLEIGGPSATFRRRGLLPVYPVAARIDNCNFSARTIWGDATEGEAGFLFDKRTPRGKQLFLEATDLRAISSNSYDFVLSSHVLEHVANPLLAISEWTRVIKPAGILTLVVPHGEGTFDHRRPVTDLEHLVADFERETTEADTTHHAEILRLHDLSRDPEAGDMEAFRKRVGNNSENRGVHHHVFNTALAVELIDYSGLQILAVEATRPYHIFVVAQKLTDGQIPHNDKFTGRKATYRSSSPFATDRST